jgi:hypothetical protein
LWSSFHEFVIFLVSETKVVMVRIYWGGDKLQTGPILTMPDIWVIIRLAS